MNSPVDSTDSPSETDNKQSSEEADGLEELPEAEEEKEFYFLVNGVCKSASKVNGLWFGSFQECCMSIVSVCTLKKQLSHLYVVKCQSVSHSQLSFCFFQPSLEDRNNCLKSSADNQPSSPVSVSDFSNGGVHTTMGSSMLIMSLLFFQLM